MNMTQFTVFPTLVRWHIHNGMAPRIKSNIPQDIDPEFQVYIASQLSVHVELVVHQYRADLRLAPSQWETPLQSNAISHWLGANLKSALWIHHPKQMYRHYHTHRYRLLLGFVRTRVLMSRSRLNNGATHGGWHFDIHRDFDTRGR